ncbi:MAG: TetR/AcrR family transcriptional regulator [Planctomycetota bacterium]
MNRLTREVFVKQTCELLKERGRIDFALSDLLDACGARKGSLYHFFPDGKGEVILAAVEHMSQCALAHVSGCLEAEDSVSDAVFRVVNELAMWIETPGRFNAIPFTAIAAITGADDEAVRLACQQALQRVQTRFIKPLQDEGLKRKDAKSLAVFIVTVIEGAFLYSRTVQTSEPLRNAAVHLKKAIDGAQKR